MKKYMLKCFTLMTIFFVMLALLMVPVSVPADTGQTAYATANGNIQDSAVSIMQADLAATMAANNSQNSQETSVPTVATIANKLPNCAKARGVKNAAAEIVLSAVLNSATVKSIDAITVELDTTDIQRRDTMRVYNSSYAIVLNSVLDTTIATSLRTYNVLNQQPLVLLGVTNSAAPVNRVNSRLVVMHMKAPISVLTPIITANKITGTVAHNSS